MFIELRELLCSGAIRRHQLGAKDLLTLVSLIIAFLEKQASKKDRLKTNLRCDERKLPVRMDVSALQPDKIFDKINEAAPNNKE